MKKILPIIALIGSSTLLTGCTNNLTKVNASNISENLNTFAESIYDCNLSNTDSLSSTRLEKYKLNIVTPAESEQSTEDTPIENENNDISTLEEPIIDNLENTTSNDETTIKNENLSTLYSLSNDVEQNSEEFINLKENITQAIIETENLLSKVKSKELALTREQRIFLTEQSSQLKNLGKQLSSITTELNFNLSDLQQILSENNQDVDNLSLKYLIVLDNLVNGNEMLQSGLTSLSLMNQMLNSQPTILPPNNDSRIIYGFRQNNNPPVIKEYVVNEDGELVEDKQDNTKEDETELEEDTNIDTYNTPVFKHNIDTYHSNNPKNIDTFFNTALFDNEMMYGKGYGGYNYGFNPYLNQYTQYENYNQNNSTNNNTNSVDNNNSTQGVDNDGEKIGNKERKNFKLIKNIDTYQDEKTPTLKMKFAKIKESLNKIFNK